MSRDRDAEGSGSAPLQEARPTTLASERVLAVLAELVRLKDIKDRDGESEDYRLHKDRAWEEARRIIAERSHTASG